MNVRISSFSPLIWEDSKVLILGSVPGVKSLEMQEYYANPQNKFWRILFDLFQEDFSTDYSEKLKFLEKNHLALWDVIDTCERNGSLDSKIINEESNDIQKLLTDFPNIKTIFCNGQKSFKNLQKILNKDHKIPRFALPSTSPAYTISYENKLMEWSVLKSQL
jgi:hypoxanthine-DNA glycosylase